MIQRGEEMVEHMITKVGEDQELRPLKITAINDSVYLEETPVAILAIRIALVIDFRIVMGSIQTDHTEAKAGDRRHREPCAHANPNTRRSSSSQVYSDGYTQRHQIVPVEDVRVAQRVENTAITISINQNDH